MAGSYIPYSGMTPDEVRQGRQTGQMYQRAGMTPEHMTHWTQALGKVLQSGVGAAWQDRANQGEREGRSSANQLLAQTLQGGDVKGNIGRMLANEWAAEQGGALASRYLQHQLDAQSPDAALRRQQIELGNKQLREQIAERQQMAPLRKQQMELQNKELELKSSDPTRAFMRGILGPDAGQGQPQGGNKQQPQGGAVIPQSAPVDVEGGQLIQTQAAVPQQAQPRPDMVQLPGFPRPLTRQEAEQLKLYAIINKNDMLAKHIEDAIGSGLDKGARTELDKTRINLTNQLGRLKEIEAQFNPNYQRVGTQLDMTFKAASEKLGGKLSPEHQREMERFHAYRASTIGHFNQMLKELSGTAVSAQEFERIKAQMPNAGTGFANGAWDGDSETIFKAKLAQATATVKLALARANFIAKQGFRGDLDALAAAMPLDDMPQIIERRGQLLEQNLKQQYPKASLQDIQRQVDQQLKQEFGI